MACMFEVGRQLMRHYSSNQKHSTYEVLYDWIHFGLLKRSSKFWSYLISKEVSRFSLLLVFNQEQYWDNFELKFSSPGWNCLAVGYRHLLQSSCSKDANLEHQMVVSKHIAHTKQLLVTKHLYSKCMAETKLSQEISSKVCPHRSWLSLK
jgi:hypothetical protein